MAAQQRISVYAERDALRDYRKHKNQGCVLRNAELLHIHVRNRAETFAREHPYQGLTTNAVAESYNHAYVHAYCQAREERPVAQESGRM